MTEAKGTDNHELEENQYLHLIWKNNQIYKVLCSSPKNIDLENQLQINQYFDSGIELEVREYDTLVYKIICMGEFSDIPEDKINRAGVLFARNVACEFYRKTFDPRLANYKLSSQSNQRYIFIKEEAYLWEKIYIMLQDLYSSADRYIDEAEYLACRSLFNLVGDKLLLLVTIGTKVKNESAKGMFLKEIQGENRKLNGLENPFPSNTLTSELINRVIDKIGSNPTSIKKHYKEMVKARMALAQRMKGASVAAIQIQGKNIEWRGKRK